MNNGWPMVPLREVLAARDEVPSPNDLASGTIRVVAKIGFNDGQIQLRNDGTTRTGMILARPGDILVSGINAAKGAIAIYCEKSSDPIAATIHYGAYIPNQGKVSTSFLWWLLRSSRFREILAEYVPGGIKTELKAKRLLPVPIPLPPLAEQRRIVSKIEQLATKIEEARGLRRLAMCEVESLDASLLTTLIPQDVPIKPLAGVIEPSSKISYGVLVPGPHVDGGIPFVRVQDLDPKAPPSEPSKRIAPNIEEAYARTRLAGGEVLLAVVGATIGKVGVVPTCWKGANIARAVCRIVPGPDVVRDYLVAVLQSKASQQYFEEATRTLAQPTLNVAQLKQTQVPLPRLDEQRRIVAYIQRQQAKLDRLKAAQAETAAELDALLPSILDKAFKGEL